MKIKINKKYIKPNLIKKHMVGSTKHLFLSMVFSTMWCTLG